MVVGVVLPILARAMECTETAVPLGKAFDVFGPDGPATDRKTRQAQLAALTDDQDKTLDSINGEFYSNKEDRDLKRLLYAIQNKADFTSKESAH